MWMTPSRSEDVCKKVWSALKLFLVQIQMACSVLFHLSLGIFPNGWFSVASLLLNITVYLNNLFLASTNLTFFFSNSYCSLFCLTDFYNWLTIFLHFGIVFPVGSNFIMFNHLKSNLIRSIPIIEIYTHSFVLPWIIFCFPLSDLTLTNVCPSSSSSFSPSQTSSWTTHWQMTSARTTSWWGCCSGKLMQLCRSSGRSVRLPSRCWRVWW